MCWIKLLVHTRFDENSVLVYEDWLCNALSPSLQTRSSLETACSRSIGTWWLVSKLVTKPLYFDRALFQQKTQLAGHFFPYFVLYLFLPDIDDEFKTQLRELIPSVLSADNLVVKSINGGEVTCRGLLEYFKVSKQTLLELHCACDCWSFIAMVLPRSSSVTVNFIARLRALKCSICGVIPWSLLLRSIV